MSELDPALHAEFDARPWGRHTPHLQAVLERMRSAPIPGKALLYMTEPHSHWALARMSTSSPYRLEVGGQSVFNDLLDAERHVFQGSPD